MTIKTKISVGFLFALFLFGGIELRAQTQTSPKKQTTAKKPAAKKKGKATKKAGSVFICDGTNGYTYHSRKTCKDLVKCKGRILEMTQQEATGNYGRKVCKNCH